MVLRRMLLICTGWRCGGRWRAKLSRFCTISFVRWASSRITCRSLRALPGTSGFSISRSENPMMAVRGLLTSWATPETNCPTAAIFSVCMSLAWIIAASVGIADQSGSIGNDDHGLRVIQYLAGEITLTLELPLEVFDFRDVEVHTAILENVVL